MEALRFCPKSKTLSLEKSIEIPKIVNPDDVLIEVAFSGLCGTDIHIVQVGRISSFLRKNNYNSRHSGRVQLPFREATYAWT